MTQSASPWAPLSSPTFRALWTANLVSDIGGAMQLVGAGWLMTQMDSSPLVVASVQAASMLPVFLLLLPAGALGDILDRRRILLFAQSWCAVSALLLGVISAAGLMSPAILLLLSLMMGIGVAIATPSFQAVVPQLVPRDDLPAAVGLSSMAINVARAVGPAIAGVSISLLGVASVFFFNAASFLVVVAVLWRWRRPAQTNPLPAEHFLSALRTGWRYATHNPPLVAVLIRSAAFFSFASGLWALLPLVGLQKAVQGANGYAILLSGLGAGAVLAALTLPKVRPRLSPDALCIVATLIFAASMIGAALIDDFHVVAALMLPAGWAWLASLTTLNIAARFSIADWVMSRGLAINQMTFFGCQVLGSILWGHVASQTSIAVALLASAGGMIVALATALRFRLITPAKDELQPSLHWAEPMVLLDDIDDRGPVLTTIEYRIDPSQAGAFLKALHQLKTSRQRDGGYGWGVFEDTEQPGRYVEQFFTESWAEHVRQHRRRTLADKSLQDAVRTFHRGDAAPRVTHLASAVSSGGESR